MVDKCSRGVRRGWEGVRMYVKRGAVGGRALDR